MDYQPPAPAHDAAAAGWIASRLVEQFGAVCATIPTGFPAYARLLHPVDAGKVALTRWAEVAESNGRTVHPLAQFERVSSPRDPAARTPLRDVQAAMTGDLGAEHLRALCEILKGYTSDGDQCWFAVWEGWGEISGGSSVMSATRGGTAMAPRDAPAPWQLDLRAAKFALPGRTYYLEELVHSDAFETWPIGSLDSLVWDADTINQP